jgi:surface polysaccharide O-acyltransferase-like enzyme
MIDRRKEKNDWTPAILAVATTVMAALATLTPYVMLVPEKNITLITQSQTTLYTAWIMVLGYYFGSSKNQTRAQETIATQAATAQAAGAALASVAGIKDGEVRLNPGDEVKVAAVDTDPAAGGTERGQSA